MRCNLCQHGGSESAGDLARISLLTMIFFLRFFLRKVKRRRNRLSLGQTTYPLFYVARGTGTEHAGVDERTAEYWSEREPQARREERQTKRGTRQWSVQTSKTTRPVHLKNPSQVLCLVTAADAPGVPDPWPSVHVNRFVLFREKNRRPSTVGIPNLTRLGTTGQPCTANTRVCIVV